MLHCSPKLERRKVHSICWCGSQNIPSLPQWFQWCLLLHWKHKSFSYFWWHEALVKSGCPVPRPAQKASFHLRFRWTQLPVSFLSSFPIFQQPLSQRINRRRTDDLNRVSCLERQHNQRCGQSSQHRFQEKTCHRKLLKGSYHSPLWAGLNWNHQILMIWKSMKWS